MAANAAHHLQKQLCGLSACERTVTTAWIERMRRETIGRPNMPLYQLIDIGADSRHGPRPIRITQALLKPMCAATKRVRRPPVSAHHAHHQDSLYTAAASRVYQGGARFSGTNRSPRPKRTRLYGGDHMRQPFKYGNERLFVLRIRIVHLARAKPLSNHPLITIISNNRARR